MGFADVPMLSRVSLISSETADAAIPQQLGSRAKHSDQQSSVGDLPLSGIPLPTSEQRAIAAALSDVDALLGGLDRLIAKKRDLKQAAMQQLLTGQTRLPGFTGSGR